MANFEDVNEAAKGHTDFRIESFDGQRLIVVGSFDLSYYHYIEVHFVDVDRIDCPVWFDCPVFTDEGQIDDPDAGVREPRRFVIRTPEGRHTIVARAAEVVLGMVYHYDRGDQLLPGERVADWVKRGPGERTPAPDRGDGDTART